MPDRGNDAGAPHASDRGGIRPFGRPYRFGLDRHTSNFTRRVTENLLRAYADGPAAAKHPAHDNLAAMHEWAGDPIAANHNLWPPVVL